MKILKVVLKTAIMDKNDTVTILPLYKHKIQPNKNNKLSGILLRRLPRVLGGTYNLVINPESSGLCQLIELISNKNLYYVVS
jgi:hypothetical protein